MHGKISNALVCAVVTVLLVFASAPGKCANTVTLNYSIFFPATHAHTLLATEWAKEVEKRTNGAVKVNMFPGGTLTPPDQCYDGVVKGISDIGMSVVSYTMGRFPLTEVIDLPLGYTSGIQATRLSNAYFEKFKPKEFDAVKMMYMHVYGPGIVHTAKKPVKVMEDLKGMKVRCSGTSAKVVGALGATPVAMPQTEVYDALQKGIVGGSRLSHRSSQRIQTHRSYQVYHAELWLFLLSRLFRRDEQEEMGFSAQRCPGNHRENQQGMDRQNRPDLGSNRQGSKGIRLAQRPRVHFSIKRRGRALGPGGKANYGRVRRQQ